MSRAFAEVIGDPISHSKSPLIHNFWLAKAGIDADYRSCHVRPEELADYLADRRKDPDWRGCNVTIPHKEAITQLVDEMDGRANGIGAVNTVLHRQGKLLGTNTDFDGVADALVSHNLSGQDVVVLGAGGAARSAFAVLATFGCRSVRVLARTQDKAIRAASANGLEIDLLPFTSQSRNAFDGATALINATQLGMTGQDPMPQFVLDSLADMRRQGLVFDMVYSPLETALLRAARAAGLSTSDGLVMLIGQAATAFEKFFGHPAPRQHDADLRALLTA